MPLRKPLHGIVKAVSGKEFVTGDAKPAVHFAVDAAVFVATTDFGEGQGNGFDGLANLAGLLRSDVAAGVAEGGFQFFQAFFMID